MALVLKKLSNIESSTAALNRRVNILESDVEGQSKRLKAVEGATNTQNLKIEDLQKRHSSIIPEINENVGEQMKSFRETIRKDNELFRAEMINFNNKKIEKVTVEIKAEVKAEVKADVQDQILEGQCEARKINLIVVGIHEAQEGETDLQLVTNLITGRMGISNVDIKMVYRLGKLGASGHRPILVRFANIPQRNKVWFAKSKLKQENDQERKVWLQEDLPKRVKDARKNLYSIFKKAKTLEGELGLAQLKGTKLILGGKPYGENDLHTLPEALKPSNMATIQSDSVVIFFGKASPLSNHHPSPFTLEDHQFATVEQFLAWKRGTLSGNQSLINKALISTNPTTCKSILNDLKQDNIEQWAQQRGQIALVGVRAKFVQNTDLANFLRNTHPKQLGETSFNKVWGIGIPLNNSQATDPTKWVKDGNLLGTTLTQIREELLEKPLEG